MRNTFYVCKREFKAYFTSPLAYVLLLVFLGLINHLFFKTFFLAGQASVRSLFSLMPTIFFIFVPAITMRLWAEEKKQGTIEFLLTMPLRDVEVVAGKYIASLLFLALAALLTLNIPFTADYLAEGDTGIDWGPVVGGYAGTILLGAAYLSIGLFASSLTSNQIIAFIVGVVMCFVLFIIGDPYETGFMPPALVPLASFIGLGAHFQRLLAGLVDSRDIIYYVSVIVFFLYLNIRILESRNYR